MMVWPVFSEYSRNFFIRYGTDRDSFIKALFILAVCIFLMSDTVLGMVLRQSFVDAYLSVSVFVGFTLFLIYGIERLFRFDFGTFNLRHPQWQVLTSAGLGALPGCGGAIIVLTQYVKGQVSFGGVIAVLTATMGDAAFLLIAAEPVTAMYVLGISLLGGVVTGMLVDMIHGPDFLRIKQDDDVETSCDFSDGSEKASPIMKRLALIAFLVMLPGMVVGGMMAFQMEIPEDIETGLGLLGIFTLIAVWTGLNGRIPIANYISNEKGYSLISRVIEDTAFITIWVVFAFFLFEFAVNVLDLDLQGLFMAAGWTLPMIGILVGFIPGCGPQIIVTTMYINGLVPLSVQIGNAISNDGDALFPAIAVAPKAAIIATLYSALPALIISYSYFFLFE